MNRTAGLIGSGAGLMLLAVVAGCGSNASQPPPTHPPAGPKLVTDLSTLSSGNALNPFSKAAAAGVADLPQTASQAAGATEQAMGTARHVGDDKHPCEERLLNKKAAKFDMLSMRVLDQLASAMRDLEDQEPIVRMKLPTELRPVILTAFLSPQGKLREIVIEQHSGVAAVDKMLVKACKRALYVNNPPADALSGNGDYEMRVEARIENYSTLDSEHWQFKTYIGLAIL